MNLEEWLYQRCAYVGRGWQWGLYLLVAKINGWWYYASSFERWTVRVAAMLTAIMAGLVLAQVIGG